MPGSTAKDHRRVAVWLALLRCQEIIKADTQCWAYGPFVKGRISRGPVRASQKLETLREEDQGLQVALAW